jgi:hypothetical protein
MRTANVVAHYNVRQISTAFHIPAAIARAAHILLSHTQINLSTDLRGASTARQFRKPRLRASLCNLSGVLN